MENVKELTYEDGFYEGFELGREAMLETIIGVDKSSKDPVAWMYIRESGAAFISLIEKDAPNDFKKVPLYIGEV